MLLILCLDSVTIESCKDLNITAIHVGSCSPYTYYWSYDSNSTNSKAQAIVNTFLTNARERKTDNNLTIPAGTLEFGIEYTFTVMVLNENDVLYPLPLTTTFITIGGNVCSNSITFPNFSITHNGKIILSKAVA